MSLEHNKAVVRRLYAALDGGPDVAADQGMAMTRLGIEPADIVIQHAERKPSPTYVRRAATIGSVKLPGPYRAHLIHSPGWK